MSPVFAAPPPVRASLPTAQLPGWLEGWNLDSRSRSCSPRTLETRTLLAEKLCWFLTTKNHDCCGTAEMRQFFLYLREGHTEPGGRWGTARLTQPMKPVSVKDYYNRLRTFFRWLVTEGVLTASPLDIIRAPVAREDDIIPFTPAQVAALQAAALAGRNPRRDLAILLMLVDTGLRVSEMCALNGSDINHQTRALAVVGKGQKKRLVHFGAGTARALWRYHQQRFPGQVKGDDVPGGAALFTSDRGPGAGGRITRNGIGQMFQRMGLLAKVENARCSPHTCRHTFAISYLTNGGQPFALMRLLGHTKMETTLRYVRYTQAMMGEQYQMLSPVDRMAGRV